MSIMIWNDSLSVGINSIDEQHKNIVNMLNSLHDSLEQGSVETVLKKIFDGLAIYTVKHFAYEEDLFEEFAYTGTAAHIAEHDRLINQVMELKERMENGDDKISHEVLEFLRDWLLHHIMQTDMAYADELKSKGL